MIPVKWGVEAVWALLTPKNVHQTHKVQKIVCAAIYSKPVSKHKSDLLDHIYEAFNIVSAKFGRGLHFIIAGDTNDLRLKSIMDLSPSLVQIVSKPTRTDKTTGKKAMLDPIITTLSQYYQEPQVLGPLDSDPDKNGKPSDHNILLVQPISVFNNKNARITQKIEIRPVTEAGIQQMKNWLSGEDWKTVSNAKTSNDKANTFQDIMVTKYKEFFPIKIIKVTNDDQPWISQKLKQLDRKQKRIYNKNQRSEAWKLLDKKFKKEVKSAKADFYKKDGCRFEVKETRPMVQCSKEDDII